MCQLPNLKLQQLMKQAEADAIRAKETARLEQKNKEDALSHLLRIQLMLARRPI